MLGRDQEPPEREGSARAFFRGLTRPSIGALAITLAVPLVALALCVILITPELLASEAHRYFARDGADGDLFLTARLAAVSQVRPKRPVVAVLGGSAMVESFANAKMLRRVVKHSSDVDVGVWALASWGQSLQVSLEITERLPRRFDGIVLIGVTPFGMALGPEMRPGMLAETRELDDADALGLAVDFDSSRFFWANRRFFLPRLGHLVSNLREGPVTEAVHPFTRRKSPMPAGVFADVAPKLRERIETGYEANFEACLETIEAIVEELRGRGRIEIVVVESPLSPRGVSEILGEAFWARHKSRLQEFASARRIHYWFPQEDAMIGQEDFYDLNHLFRWPAIRRYTRILGQRSADLLMAMEESA